MVTFFAISQGAKTSALKEKKIVCYYDSSSTDRLALGHFDYVSLEGAIPLCTHLIYGYAGIDEKTFHMIPLNITRDLTKRNYQSVTSLKNRFPGLKVLLSVGGGRDGEYNDDRKVKKYLKMLESGDHRFEFVNSVPFFLKQYGFDGLDLGYEFAETKPKKVRGKIGGFFNKIKESVVGESVVDKKAAEHKQEFTSLVKELNEKLKKDNLLLTLSVLPNVNSSIYLEPKLIADSVDFVILKAFDFYTPERNPKEADHAAPIYEEAEKRFDENINFQVTHWLKEGFNPNKLVLAIPTFGRAWKMTEDSGSDGFPPVKEIDEAAEAGPYTKVAGLLSYPEICNKIVNPTKISMNTNHLLTKGGNSARSGVYAFRPVDKNNPEGIWISFEDQSSVGAKATFAKIKDLGGIAVDDITLDDFQGFCTFDKYPLLRAARNGYLF